MMNNVVQDECELVEGRTSEGRTREGQEKSNDHKGMIRMEGIKMRRLRYQVACSLDGYIAGPNDEFDWIPPEPGFDFEALYDQFDTFVMGRRTYEVVKDIGVLLPNKQIIVASRSLRQENHPGIEVVSEGLQARIQQLLREPGKDIWLYGGGELFSQMLEWDLVDTIELAILPIILGGGIPFIVSKGIRRRLTLIGHQAYPAGMVLIEYKIEKQWNENQ